MGAQDFTSSIVAIICIVSIYFLLSRSCQEDREEIDEEHESSEE